MKWGVRRYQNKDGTRIARANKQIKDFAWGKDGSATRARNLASREVNERRAKRIIDVIQSPGFLAQKVNSILLGEKAQRSVANFMKQTGIMANKVNDYLFGLNNDTTDAVNQLASILSLGTLTSGIKK